MLDVFIKWTLQGKKPLEYVICDTYGVGINTSRLLISRYGFQNGFPMGRLNSNNIKESITRDIRRMSNALPIQTALKEKLRKDVDFLKGIRCYRGLRHITHLSVRGQRSKTNCRTQKTGKPNFRALRTSYRHERSSQNVIRGNIKRVVSEVSEFKISDKFRSRRRVFLGIHTHSIKNDKNKF